MRNIFIALVVLASLASAAHAEQFDTTFAGTGRYQSEPVWQHRNAIAMLERPDGHLVLISRYPCTFSVSQACLATTFMTADGIPTSVSEGGPDGMNFITGAAMDSVGRYVIVGTSVSSANGLHNFRAQRWLPNGTKDESFGVLGEVEVDFNEFDDYANAVAIDADDNVVIVGEAGNSTTNSDFGVIRLRSVDGLLDTTFNGTGKATVSFDLGSGNKFDKARAIAIAASGGRITVVGSAFDSNPGVLREKAAIARFNSNGSLDTSFCNPSCTGHNAYPNINSGRRIYYFGASSSLGHYVNGVALLENGDFYIAGSTYDSGNFTGLPAISRLSESGDYTAEMVSTDYSGQNAYSSVQVSDAFGQRVLVAGYHNDLNGPSFMLLRAFDSNLTPLNGYGDCMGSSAFCFGGSGSNDNGQDYSGALNIDHSGRHLFAGTYIESSGNYRRSVFARFTNDTGPKPDLIFRNAFQ